MTNTFEKKIVPIKELASGDYLNLTLYRITGKEPGPHVHIQSSVHGAELQGNLVIMELMRQFSRTPIKGSITFIPLANPQATNNKNGTHSQGRYNPITGHNWNRNYSDITADLAVEAFAKEHLETPWPQLKRAFKQHILETCNKTMTKLNTDHGHVSENRKLNLLLQKIAAPADIVLDLHTGPVACRYLYSATYQKHVAPDLLSPYTLIIPNEFAGAMDEACFMPWVTLHRELEKLGRTEAFDTFSFTVELGSEEVVSSKEAQSDAARILYFLYKRGVLAENLVAELTPGKWSELEKYNTYYASHGGLFESVVKPGEEYAKGDVLGFIHRPRAVEALDKVDDAIIKVIALESGAVINHTPTAAVSEGMELIQVLADVRPWS